MEALWKPSSRTWLPAGSFGSCSPSLIELVAIHRAGIVVIVRQGEFVLLRYRGASTPRGGDGLETRLPPRSTPAGARLQRDRVVRVATASDLRNQPDELLDSASEARHGAPSASHHAWEERTAHRGWRLGRRIIAISHGYPSGYVIGSRRRRLPARSPSWPRLRARFAWLRARQSLFSKRLWHVGTRVVATPSTSLDLYVPTPVVTTSS